MRAGDPGVRVADSCRDTVVRGVQGARVADDGTRTVVDGWGTNEGDPGSTGAWNGNGREGAAVVDTTSGDSHVYRGGSWN
jgi:hypothetical protein